MKSFTPTVYSLMNVATGRVFPDAGWMLADPESPKPSLVRTVYQKKQIDVKGSDWGFYRFADWLPVHRLLQNSATTVTYRSEGLARELGLGNLYITFSGYWPERGALMKTCSFKETEAYSVCGRLSRDCKQILTVASAGNTARAFTKVCSDNNIPLLLCVPHDNIDALWFEKPIRDCVKLVCAPAGSDYFDAIAISQIASSSGMFIDEGGAKNVARRDGMGTTVLSATVEIGRIPDAYFQAIGSGTGAIAAHEANLRLLEDGRFGSARMKLHTVQNIPFVPMYDAWKAGQRDLLPFDDDDARQKAAMIDAKVLSNRKPPYSIAGGVYDCMKDTQGEMYAVTNAEIRHCAAMFKELEGVDIYSASGAALAGLVQAVNAGTVGRDDVIMLNITGGGELHFKKDCKVHMLKPSLVISPSEDREKIIREIERLFA